MTNGFPPPEELPILSMPYQIFVEALMFDIKCGGDASKAYSKAYPNAARQTAINGACKLRKNPDIIQWIAALNATNLNRMLCTKAEHISELAKLREEARELGNINGAIKAEEARGRVAGHYIERKEIIHRRDDDLSTLIQLAREGRRDIAEDYAKSLGLTQQLIEGLDGVFEVEENEEVFMPPPPKSYTEI